VWADPPLTAAGSAKEPRRRARLARARAKARQIPNADEQITISNSGTGPLSITNITSSSPDFLAPSVLSYPITLEIGDAIDVAVRFAPLTLGAKSATITVFSDDPAGPHTVQVSGLAPAPRLSLIIANSGNFGRVCVDRFAEESLVLNNGGPCPLTVSAISSSSTEFLVPQVHSFPLVIGPGASLAMPIRFAPTSFGPKTATITVRVQASERAEHRPLRRGSERTAQQRSRDMLWVKLSRSWHPANAGASRLLPRVPAKVS
jgi:hypothetical protein